MSWVRVESSVRTNRKFLKAGPAPSWLWLCGLAYCQEGLTDGFIPDEAIDYLGVKNGRRLAGHLVRVGLWDAAEGGWQIHDYLEHNKPASEIRRINRARADGGNLGGRPRLTIEVPLKVNLPENPSVPVSVAVPENNPPAGGYARARGGAPLIDQREHRKHAHCGRVCLHASLFGEFVRRRNHDDADREVRDWALDVERDWAPGGVFEATETGDSFDFWRARYDEKWPAPMRGKGPAWMTEAV